MKRLGLKRLGLKVVVRQILQTTTSNDLPGIKEVLKKLNNALTALETPILDQAETLRLRTIIQAVKTYKELFADYVDDRGIEVELVDLREKYEELAKKPRMFWTINSWHVSSIKTSLSKLFPEA